MKTTIGFPGLGIEQFEINRVAFKIGSLTVYWYGLIIALGIILAFAYFLWRAQKFERISEDNCYSIALFTIPISIVGSRFLYVITNLDKYDTFWDAIAIWNGGIAIYGSIIFGAITISVYCKIKKLNILSVLDAAAPAVMIGQIMGRWGNFVNGEAYGWSENIENLPWRMVVNGITAHPTFFYESMWNLIGFLLINFIYKKKKFTGQCFLMYVSWYGLGRGFIELLRTDSLYIFDTIKLNSVLGFTAFVLGAATLVFMYIRSKKSVSEYDRYKAAYAEAEEEKQQETTECEDEQNGSNT